ncbi:MAG TPA: hypothetical protein VMZ28_02205 [Kofleriaceae bacterium]|nr:hypothetical protein [Kofleriaceae bacterium]
MKRLAAAALLLAACAHRHRDTNAPGIQDIEAPPPDLTNHQPIEPQDPGERMLTINPGVLAGGGGRSASPHGFGEFGVEVTVNGGESPGSHAEDNFVVYPAEGFGATLGWSALRLLDDPGDDDAQVGPFYAEVQGFEFPYAGGVGYAVDPWHGQHGPQVFVFLLSGYLRARYLWDEGTEVTLGFQLKLPKVWVWSR